MRTGAEVNRGSVSEVPVNRRSLPEHAAAMNALERDDAIARHLPLVRIIARTVALRAPWVDFEDLVGNGMLGLICAIDSYDPERGLRLESYVRRKIFYAMLDAARREDQVSALVRRVLAHAERDRFALAIELGRMPSTAELERRHPKLRSALGVAHLRRRIPLETVSDIDRCVAPDWSTDPATVVCARETERSVMRAVDKLSPRHRELLGMHYFAGLRLVELAERMSITTQRVAQIRDSALATLRSEVIAS